MPLAPLSKALIHDVFMEIEEPETPLAFPLEAKSLLPEPPATIGEFYAAIRKQFSRLAEEDDIFTGKLSRQLTMGIPGLRSVTDLASAHSAVDLIVRQGEGTQDSPLNQAGEPAHYYRFASAYHGRELVARDDPPGFAYGGEEIPFDPDGVVPLAVNPTSSRYHSSPAAGLNEQFNRTYTALLKQLQRAVSGTPTAIFGATSMMRQLRGAARALGEVEVEPGLCAGPTFTYTPM